MKISERISSGYIEEVLREAQARVAIAPHTADRVGRELRRGAVGYAGKEILTLTVFDIIIVGGLTLVGGIPGLIGGILFALTADVPILAKARRVYKVGTNYRRSAR